MALIKCSECGKEVSDKASKCVHCGCPIKKEEKKMFCVECGNELKKTDKVCGKCGCPIDNKNNKNNVKKENMFLNIVRYLIGLFFFMFVFTTTGISLLLIILAVALILPITSKYIYRKINIPKALKIIIPIILIIIAMCVNPSFKESYNEGYQNAKGNINEQNLEKWLKIYASGTTYSGNVFKPIISISPLEKNYTCKDVSFTLNTYISYEDNKISSEKPIEIKLNENCKFYSKDEISFQLTTNPHASARVKYTIEYVKGTIKE